VIGQHEVPAAGEIGKRVVGRDEDDEAEVAPAVVVGRNVDEEFLMSRFEVVFDMGRSEWKRRWRAVERLDEAAVPRFHRGGSDGACEQCGSE